MLSYFFFGKTEFLVIKKKTQQILVIAKPVSFSLHCADVYDDPLDKCFLLKWQFCVPIVKTALKQKWIQFYFFETCERIIFVILPLDILH